MADRSRTIVTAETARDTLGVGGIINPNHSGTLKRPAETAAEHHLDKVKSEVRSTVIPRSVALDNNGNKLYIVNGKRVTQEEYESSR